MTAYRRLRVPGGTYVFTVALADRTNTALVTHIDTLRSAVRMTRDERPFDINAWVVLPDHLIAVWTLPEGDADFSTRWRLIKARFSRAVDQDPPRSASKRRKQERGVWQRRFWEHAIRDPADHAAHVRYCWANPVRHGLVARPDAWPYSSIHRDIRRGMVEPEWHGGAMPGAVREP